MAGGCMLNEYFSFPYICMLVIVVVAHTAVCSSGEDRAGHLVSPPGQEQGQWLGSSSDVARTVFTTIATTTTTVHDTSTLPLATRLGSGASGQAPSPFGPTGPDTAHQCPTRPVWTYGGTGPTPGGRSPPRRLTPAAYLSCSLPSSAI